MKLLTLILKGIAWGCTICTFILMIGSATVGDSFLAVTSGEFMRQAIGSMIVGIGFTVPSLIYDKKCLNREIQILIHMGTGFIVYFPIAIYLKWIPVNAGWKMTALSILIAIIFSVVTLFCYYLYYKKEAEAINRKLNETDRSL